MGIHSLKLQVHNMQVASTHDIERSARNIAPNLKLHLDNLIACNKDVNQDRKTIGGTAGAYPICILKRKVSCR